MTESVRKYKIRKLQRRLDRLYRHDEEKLPEDQIEWITSNGEHVPIKKGSKKGAGPVSGKDFSQAESQPISELRDEDEEIKRRDEEYMKAVESGDMETAQRMVDEAAKKEGYNKRMYHGTPNGSFTEFNDWSYFTDRKEYADIYSQRSGGGNTPEDQEKSRVYSVWVKTKKPFDTRTKKCKRIFDTQFYRKWGNGAPLCASGLPDWTDGYDFVDFFDENDYDFDSIYLDEGAYGGYDQEVKRRGESLVVKDSSQVKLADPVVKDNDGNVIPLSKRFNSQSKDIRY